MLLREMYSPHTGLNRTIDILDRHQEGIPHTHGAEPAIVRPDGFISLYSPHARG